MGDRRQATGSVPAIAIFGCGRIGSALDEGGSPHVLTHAAACALQPDLHLAALCDPDPKRLAEAGAARGVESLYTDPEALLDQASIDIAVIATPTALRTSLIEAALQAGVRTFVLEKPLATSLTEAETIAGALRAADAVVAVNYLRRFASGLQAAADLLRGGTLGPLQYAGVHYGKGLNNNGSHGIDLMRWWLGEPVSATVSGQVDDGRSDDPTLHVTYEVRSAGGRVPVHFHGSDHRAVSLFEVDVVCSKGRVRVTDRGATVTTSRVIPDPAFAGYSTLDAGVTTDGGVTCAVGGLWDDMAAVVRGERGAPRCTLEDGLAALRIVEATRQAATSGERVEISDGEVRR